MRGATWVFLALGIVVVVGVLAVAGVIALPWLGDASHDRASRDAEETREGDATDVERARLRGREGEAGVATEGDATNGAATAEPPIPPEVHGTAPKGGGIKGRVVREPGAAPVAGARVRLVRPDSILHYLRVPPKGRYDALEARTGDDGRFAFRDVLPADGYVVRASVPSGGASVGDIDMRGRETKDLGDLTLGAAGSIAGRVVDARGAPVAGVRVVVSWSVENPLEVVLLDPATLEDVEREAKTGEDGAFDASGLEPGEKTVIVASSTVGSALRTPVTVAAGQPTRLPDVVLAGDAVLAGRVVWSDDTPVPDARVFASVMGNREVASADTTADGSFRIEHLDEGTYRLGVLVPGLPVKVTEEHKTGGGDVVIRFPLPAVVEGRVVRKGSGAPVTRFQVRVAPTVTDFVEAYVRKLVDKAIGGQPFEDPEGRFRLTRVPSGKVRLVVTADGFPETSGESFEVAPGKATTDVRIELADGNGLQGIVRGSDGAPMAGVPVFVSRAKAEGEDSEWEPFERDADAVTGEDGKFTLPPQTPGEYDVTAQPRDAMVATKRVDLSRPATDELELRIPPSGVVEGTVVSESGAPLARVMVELFYAAGGGTTHQTDEKGKFRVTGLAPGGVVVRWQSLQDRTHRRIAMGGGDSPQRRQAYEALRADGGEVMVAAGATTATTVRAPRLVHWTGTLRVGGKPMTGRTWGLWLSGAVGDVGRSISVDLEGRIDGWLEPGPYTLWAADGGGNWTESPFTVPVRAEFSADVDR